MSVISWPFSDARVCVRVRTAKGGGGGEGKRGEACVEQGPSRTNRARSTHFLVDLIHLSVVSRFGTKASRCAECCCKPPNRPRRRRNCYGPTDPVADGLEIAGLIPHATESFRIKALVHWHSIEKFTMSYLR